MSQNIGSSGQSFFGAVGLSEEDSYGGASGGDASYFLDVVSDGFQGDNGVDYLDTIRSRANHEGAAGEFDDSGGVDMPVGPESGLGLLLKAALGSATVTTEDPTSSGSDTVGVHTFATSDLLPSLGVELAVGSVDTVLHKGVGVESLELSHAAGDRLTASLDLPAQVPEITGTDLTPTYSDLLTFMWHHGVVSIGGTDRTADIQDVSINISNSLEKLTRGERWPGKMMVGNREVTASVTLDFETMELWELFFGGAGATGPQDTLADVALNATWTSPEQIGPTTESYTLDWDMPRCRMDTHDAQLDTNNLVAENVELTALVDPTAGYDVQATLKNGVTTAY